MIEMMPKWFPALLPTLGVLAVAAFVLAPLEAERAGLRQVQSVYLLPMGYGLDQYLANRLTAEGVFEVVTDPTVVADLVRQAMELLPTESTLEIHLNPADLQALQGTLGESVPPARGMSIEWSPDVTLERGSFVMETPLRLINGRADIALRKLYDRMDRHA